MILKLSGSDRSDVMTEELMRKFCELRAQNLRMTGAQKWAFTEKAVELWTSGSQCETALKRAAEAITTCD